MERFDRFRPYRKGDLQQVWKTLRPADFVEYDAVNFTNPELLEEYVTEEGSRLVTWECEEGPVSILGVGRTESEGVGGVWSITSTKADTRWRFAVRNTAACLDQLGAGYLLLANYKAASNTQQINWLRRIGFTFFRTEENFMGSGVPFHQFVRIVK